MPRRLFCLASLVGLVTRGNSAEAAQELSKYVPGAPETKAIEQFHFDFPTEGWDTIKDFGKRGLTGRVPSQGGQRSDISGAWFAWRSSDLIAGFAFDLHLGVGCLGPWSEQPPAKAQFVTSRGWETKMRTDFHPFDFKRQQADLLRLVDRMYLFFENPWQTVRPVTTQSGLNGLHAFGKRKPSIEYWQEIAAFPGMEGRVLVIEMRAEGKRSAGLPEDRALFERVLQSVKEKSQP